MALAATRGRTLTQVVVERVGRRTGGGGLSNPLARTWFGIRCSIQLLLNLFDRFTCLYKASCGDAEEELQAIVAPAECRGIRSWMYNFKNIIKILP